MSKYLTPQQLDMLRKTPVGKVGNRLAKVIELTEASLTEIHDQTDLSVSYISDTKSGRYKGISVDNAGRLARFFGVAIEDLFPARKAVA